MTFQTSDVSICNGNIKIPYWNINFSHLILRSSSFMFLLLLITVEVKNTICNSFITMFTQAGEIWSKSDDPNYTKFWAFLQKAVSNVKHSDILLAPFWKRFLQVKQFHDAKVFNTRLPSFLIPKNYGSLTHETRIKDAVNMEDLICLLATVRTLKGWQLHAFSP